VVSGKFIFRLIIICFFLILAVFSSVGFSFETQNKVYKVLLELRNQDDINKANVVRPFFDSTGNYKIIINELEYTGLLNSGLFFKTISEGIQVIQISEKPFQSNLPSKPNYINDTASEEIKGIELCNGYSQTDVPIYDYDTSYSVINISCAPSGMKAYEVELAYNIDHDYPMDLRGWFGTANWSNAIEDGVFCFYHPSATGNDPSDGYDSTYESYYGPYTSSLMRQQDVNQNWILAVADMYGVDEGRIDWWGITIWYEVPEPDLDVTSLSTDFSYYFPYDNVDVSATVRNIGGATAGSSYLVYLDRGNCTVNCSDWVDDDQVPSLSPGSSQTESMSFRIPCYIDTGYYYIAAHADRGRPCQGSGDGDVDESNESNNCEYVSYWVRQPVITDFYASKTTVVPGETITLTYVIYNNLGRSHAFGLGATMEGDINDEAHDVAYTLNSGTYTRTRLFTIPTGTAPGTYDLARALHNEIPSDISCMYQDTYRNLTDYLTVFIPQVYISGRLTYGTLPGGCLRDITIEANNGSETYSDVTDGSGYYEIGPLPAGTYTVEPTTTFDLFNINDWNYTPSQQQTVVVSTSNVDDIDFQLVCKATPELTLVDDGFPNSYVPGESFDVTFSLRNTNYSTIYAPIYISVSFPDDNVELVTWTSSDFVVTEPTTIYHVPDQLGECYYEVPQQYKLIDGFDRGLTFNSEKTMTLTLQPLETTTGPLLINYHASIGDKMTPGSGDYDVIDAQQGWWANQEVINQANHYISGRLTYGTLPGGCLRDITIEANNGSETYSDVTDGSGYYEIGPLPAGTYTVEPTTTFDLFNINDWNYTPSQQQTVVVSTSNVDDIDFQLVCKATPELTLVDDGFPNSYVPGESFDVTFSLRNTNYSTIYAPIYISVSFPDDNVELVTWTSSDFVVTEPTTIYHVPDQLGECYYEVPQQYKLIDGFDRGLTFNSEKTMTLTLQPLETTTGPLLINYHASIGDKMTPGSGDYDVIDAQQGWWANQEVISNNGFSYWADIYEEITRRIVSIEPSLPNAFEEILREDVYESQIDAVRVYSQNAPNDPVIVDDLDEAIKYLANISNKVVLDKGSLFWLPLNVSTYPYTWENDIIYGNDEYNIYSPIEFSTTDQWKLRNIYEIGMPWLNVGMDNPIARKDYYVKSINSAIYTVSESQFQQHFSTYLDEYQAAFNIFSDPGFSFAEQVTKVSSKLHKISKHAGVTLGALQSTISTWNTASDAIKVSRLIHLHANLDALGKFKALKTFLEQEYGSFDPVLFEAITEVENRLNGYLGIEENEITGGILTDLADMTIDFTNSGALDVCQDWAFFAAGVAAGPWSFLLSPLIAYDELSGSYQDMDNCIASTTIFYLIDIQIKSNHNNLYTTFNESDRTIYINVLERLRETFWLQTSQYVLEYLDSWMITLGYWVHFSSTEEAIEFWTDEYNDAYSALQTNTAPWYLAGEIGDWRNMKWLGTILVNTTPHILEPPASVIMANSASMNESVIIMATKAYDNYGFNVEYNFEIDGLEMGWGERIINYTWTTSGIKSVRVKARSEQAPSQETAFSPQSEITIIYSENVSVPDLSVDPLSDNYNTGDPIYFTASNAISDQGHPVQYKFNADDDRTYNWEPEGGTDAQSNSVTRNIPYLVPGSYEIRVKARSFTNPLFESDWSDPIEVTIVDDDPPIMEEIVEAENQEYALPPTFTTFRFMDNTSVLMASYQLNNYSSDGWIELFNNYEYNLWIGDGWVIPMDLWQSLPSGSNTIYFTAEDINGNYDGREGEWSWSFIKSSNSPPNMTWQGSSGYTSDGLEPESGYPNTDFVFRVKYIDSDNDAPFTDYPCVHILIDGSDIEGSPFAMIEEDSEPFTTGRTYIRTLSGLDVGNYNYRFEAQDSYGMTAEGEAIIEMAGPIVTPINSPPTISWTGEIGYESDGVSPDTGYSNSVFEYRVMYADADGDEPASGFPRLHLKVGGVPLPGSPFELPALDANPIESGRVYARELDSADLGLTPNGTYAYRFEAIDVNNDTASGDGAIETPGPVILRMPMTIWVDDKNTSGPWDGTQSHPYQGIQEGVDVSQDDDTIMVLPGNYNDENIATNGKAIRVTSRGGPDSTIIGLGAEPTGIYGFYFNESGEGSNTVIEGFKIINGSGGVYIDGAYPKLRHLIIQNPLTGIHIHSLNGPEMEVNIVACTTYCDTGIFIDCEFYDSEAPALATIDSSAIYGDSRTTLGIIHNGGGYLFINNSILNYHTLAINGPAGFSPPGGRHYINNCVFQNNDTAICGNSNIYNSSFSNNSYSLIGYYGGPSSDSVINSTFEGNTDYVFNHFSYFVFDSCSFLNNYGNIQGFAGYDYAWIEYSNSEFLGNDSLRAWGGPLGTFTLNRCIYDLNRSPIQIEGGMVRNIFNSTITRNEGGGILMFGNINSPLSVSNTIIAYNEGSGVYNRDSLPYEPNITISCCDIYGNDSGAYSGLYGTLDTDNVYSDNPLFCDTLDNDLSISNCSPCAPQNNDCDTQIGALGIGCNCGCLIWYVDANNVTGPWNGSFTYPFQTVQDGINAANNCDTIYVMPGIYNERFMILGKSPAIISTSGPDSTFFTAVADRRVITISDCPDTVSIVGFDISGGASLGDTLGDWGAGILTYNTNLKIDNCIIHDNIDDTAYTAYDGGGGIFAYNSYLSVENCEIYNNSAAYSAGGGIYFKAGSYGSIKHNYIHDNFGSFGGGIMASTGATGGDIEFNVICNNISSNDGGGIYLFDTAYTGTSYNIINNTITNNIAAYSGTGINAVMVDINGVQNVVAYNCVFEPDQAADAGNVCLLDCGSIVWDCNDVFSVISPDSCNIPLYCGIETIPDGNITENPMFCEESCGLENLHLSVNSPCAADNPLNPCGGLIGALPVDSSCGADLDYIVIEGMNVIPESTTVQYQCHAYYTDNSDRTINSCEVIWSDDCLSYGEIDNCGEFTTFDISDTVSCQIFAEYTEGDITRDTVLDITIYPLDCCIDVAEVAGATGMPAGVPVLAKCEISGVAGVEFHADYDASVILCDSIVSDIFDDPTPNCETEALHFIWDDFINPVDLSDSDTLMVLWFTCIGGIDDTGWIYCQDNIEFVDSDGEPIPDISCCDGFVYVPPCNDISGNIVYYDSVTAIPDVNVDLFGNQSGLDSTDTYGDYYFECLDPGDYTTIPSRISDDPGVSVSDIIKIRRLLAHIEPFDNIYKCIAADVNCDCRISVADVIKLRRYLAHIEDIECGNWRFIDADYIMECDEYCTDFDDYCPFPESIFVSISGQNINDADFFGIRIGDVNDTWSPTLTAKPSNAISKKLEIEDMLSSPGEIVAMAIMISDDINLAGIEMHLKYDSDQLNFMGVQSELPGEITLGSNDESIHIVWEDNNRIVSSSVNTPIVMLKFKVGDNFESATCVEFASAEVVDEKGQPYNLELNHGVIVKNDFLPDESVLPNEYCLEQNRPNPFNPITEIRFGLPEPCDVSLEIFNIMGQKVKTLVVSHLDAGFHSYSWDASGYSSGIYFTRLKAGLFTDTKKMILLK